MKSLSLLLCVILFLSLFYGCSSSHDAYNFNQGGGGTETIGVEWKGAQKDAPTDPDTNCAYLSETNNVAYIWSGNNWDTLAVSGSSSPDGMDGLNKVSLRWQGMRSEAPADPEPHWAYYDRGLRGSFIWDSTTWSVLAKNTDIESAISWHGILESAPSNPEKNWGYYNVTTGKSYLYSDYEWNFLDKDELEDLEKGTPIHWLGSYAIHPSNAKLNYLYFNNADNNTYLLTNSGWQSFAPNSSATECAFLDNKRIQWLGASDTTPVNPPINAGYYDTPLKAGFLWDGTEWIVIYMDDSDGTYNWKGALETSPQNPESNWCYYDIIKRESYLFVDTKWTSLVKNVLVDFANGDPIRWIGNLGVAPASPQINGMYYNSVEDNIYIFDGMQWQLFTINGASSETQGLDGVYVRWKGSFSIAPANPIINDAYLETTTEASLLWNGDEWAILHMPDQESSVIWCGSFDTPPTGVPTNACYFNTIDKRSYIYDGVMWYRLTREDIITN